MRCSSAVEEPGDKPDRRCVRMAASPAYLEVESNAGIALNEPIASHFGVHPGVVAPQPLSKKHRRALSLVQPLESQRDVLRLSRTNTLLSDGDS